MMSRRNILQLGGVLAGGWSVEKVMMRTAVAARPGPLENAPFDHVSINVRDFRGVVGWYQDKLGFQIEHEWQQTGTGRWIAYLTNGGSRTIEIIQTDADPLSLPEQRDLADHFKRTGYGHLCLAVRNVDATLEALAGRGVPTFVQGQTRRLGTSGQQRRIGFIKDPEGNLIELGEPLTRAV